MAESIRYRLKRIRLQWQILFWLGVWGWGLLVAGCLMPPPVASTHPLPSNVETLSQGRLNASSPKRKDDVLKTRATPTSQQNTLPGGIIIQVTPTPSPEIKIVSTPPQQEGGVPASVLLEKVPIGKQTRPLNCEFQSASDLIWYYGFPFTWDEIFEVVGHDPNGNPHVGFVGRSFDDPPGRLYPYGYGVYAEPIAEGLKRIGIHAVVHYNESQTWLKNQIASGNPVMVWVTANMEKHPAVYWTAKDGKRIKAVRGEHTNLVIGYDENGVWVADPWDGKRHHYPWSVFLASWDILDRMSLVIQENDHANP